MNSPRTHQTSVWLKNEISELKRATQVLQRFGQNCRLAGDVVNNVILAFEEVFANIVHHGCCSDSRHRIDMHIQWSAGKVRMEITDDGRPFDPLSIPPPDLDQPFEEREIGGLGVHLVRQIMDEVHYERLTGKNKIIMTLGADAAPTGG